MCLLSSTWVGSSIGKLILKKMIEWINHSHCGQNASSCNDISWYDLLVCHIHIFSAEKVCQNSLELYLVIDLLNWQLICWAAKKSANKIRLNVRASFHWLCQPTVFAQLRLSADNIWTWHSIQLIPSYWSWFICRHSMQIFSICSKAAKGKCFEIKNSVAHYLYWYIFSWSFEIGCGMCLVNQ